MLRFVTACVCAFWLSIAAAEQDPWRGLEQYFNSVQSLRGEFAEITKDEYGNVIERSSGSMALQRPDRFRWSYQEPFEQEIVADGERLWVYDKELEQVTVRPLKGVLGFGPALFLSGDLDGLREAFQIEDDGGGWLRLTPRSTEWDFQAVRLLMKGAVPEVIEVDSGLGQTVWLELYDLQRNPKLPDALFRFEPPAGIDVIESDGGL